MNKPPPWRDDYSADELNGWMNIMLIATVYRTWIHGPGDNQLSKRSDDCHGWFLILVYPSIHPHTQHTDDWTNQCRLHGIHPKLCNVNPYNVTHSTISQKHVEWMFLVEIPLLIVTFLSLISWVLPSMQIIEEVNPHPHITSHVYMWDVCFVFLFFFCFLCHLFNSWCMDTSHCPRKSSGRLTCEDDLCVMIL